MTLKFEFYLNRPHIVIVTCLINFLGLCILHVRWCQCCALKLIQMCTICMKRLSPILGYPMPVKLMKQAGIDQTALCIEWLYIPYSWAELKRKEIRFRPYSHCFATVCAQQLCMRTLCLLNVLFTNSWTTVMWYLYLASRTILIHLHSFSGLFWW